MKTLVMIPGMMCDERIFAPQIEGLSDSIRIIVADISGYSTVHELAAEVLKKSPPKFDLLGHSMGGIVAMEMYSQEPNRIEKLVLMDTNPKAELEEVKAMRDPQMKAAREGKLVDVMRDEMKPNYLDASDNRESILHTCMEMAKSMGTEVFMNQSKALQTREDQQSTLRLIDVPVLVICGSNDKLCPVERHELMHSIINHSELKIINNAGHMPTLEQPKETTEVLKKWLN
ncbi:MAG: alpha/beta hydrolase [Thiotrichales bacterium]|nr:alpha/beta hydrolase [Thiotrichales bacterium]MBT4653921.1 alpha/beta hydrolase [Thiotrichales bacterium]MBT5499633.1 alpha/beta hydrolase [Thiotrichales bacterium]MBT5983647.1 alpha/beta hydrolase [Thiotrichales bacterium]